jgi:DNA processing protein
VTLTPLFAGVRVRESSGDVEVVTRPKPWPCVPDRAKVPAVAGPCPNPAPRSTRARRLVEPFGGVQNILKASLTELEATGIQPSPHQSLGTGQSMELAHEMRRVAARGVSVVCQDDSTYRAPLKQIYDPPLILICTRECRGDCPPGDRGSWARVIPHLIGWGWPGGWPAISQTGPGNFQRLGPGVEAAAHRGAIHSQGQTVAVFGTGVDIIIYPKENSRITEQMLALGGALISEFPLNTFAPPQNFPIRKSLHQRNFNRRTSGEAAEYSGTRITSRGALEQNREVFAVPGNVTNKNSWAPNTLIKQGAKQTATWEDVWEELPTAVRLALTSATGDESQAGRTASLFGESEPLHTKERC